MNFGRHSIVDEDALLMLWRADTWRGHNGCGEPRSGSVESTPVDYSQPVDIPTVLPRPTKFPSNMIDVFFKIWVVISR
ncbi:MAG: hypothetical protein CM1200mP41_19870 [Gammaproteobacteria bacterium]|nr:MAG: hypothetical protein CM1200mP41_19870 [Gammaproteobacteria bacterium]